ncbi:MAG: WbqC family protein [Bacteroidales bacterium]|nr:WbqC family protein [Bacteroidales bacterium]
MKSGSTVLLPIAYLPPLQWFVFLFTANKVLIEQHETYPKQTYRNRCVIATSNGKLSLTIPVIKINGNHTKTREIAISYQQNWQKLHWRALVAAYANSPFFLYYQDDLEPFYTKRFENLMKFNLELMKKIMELVGIEPEFELTTTFELNPSGILDLRDEITPKKPFMLFSLPDYYQVFQEKQGFIKGLSIIDLLFNMGPETVDVLKQCAEDVDRSFK